MIIKYCCFWSKYVWANFQIWLTCLKSVIHIPWCSPFHRGSQTDKLVYFKNGNDITAYFKPQGITHFNNKVVERTSVLANYLVKMAQTVAKRLLYWPQPLPNSILVMRQSQNSLPRSYEVLRPPTKYKVLLDRVTKFCDVIITLYRSST